MEQTKNKNIIIVVLAVVVIALVVLAILFATGKISFKSNETKEEENTVTPTEEELLPEWANYLLDRNITEILYVNPLDTIPDDDYNNCPRTPLTKDDLRKLFKGMSEHKMIKTNGGIGFVGSCYAAVEIKYDDITINITEGLILTANEDPDFVKLLDKVAELQDVNGTSNYYYAFSEFQLGDFITYNILNG